MIDCAKAGAAAVHTHINAPTKDSCENGPYHALDADLEGDIFDKVFEEVDVLTLNHGWEVIKTETGERKPTTSPTIKNLSKEETAPNTYKAPSS